MQHVAKSVKYVGRVNVCQDHHLLQLGMLDKIRISVFETNSGSTSSANEMRINFFFIFIKEII